MKTANKNPKGQTEVKPLYRLRKEFIMTPEQIAAYRALPDNMPETKLNKKQLELVWNLYYKYVENKIVKGWGTQLFEIEKIEKWPSGPRMKTHEAKRIVLNNLVEINEHKTVLTAEKAADLFFNVLSCRESYTILTSKVYERTY